MSFDKNNRDLDEDMKYPGRIRETPETAANVGLFWENFVRNSTLRSLIFQENPKTKKKETDQMIKNERLKKKKKNFLEVEMVPDFSVLNSLE